jgi:hypothetical protein
MSRKVLVRKVLSFKSVHVTPHFLGNSPACTLENTVCPIYVLVCFIPVAIYEASIKLLDVNEVAIIIMILGEQHHLNFLTIIAIGLYTRNYHNNFGRATASHF